MELYKIAKSLLQSELARKLTRNAGVQFLRRDAKFAKSSVFNGISAKNIAIMMNTTFGRGENPLFNGCALLASLALF